jgi:hypothetical protein
MSNLKETLFLTFFDKIKNEQARALSFFPTALMQGRRWRKLEALNFNLEEFNHGSNWA